MNDALAPTNATTSTVPATGPSRADRGSADPMCADLIGTWTLVDWQVVVGGLAVPGPFGESPRGLLIYHEDGGVAAELSYAERPPFGTALFLYGEPDQRDRAALTYLSYAGTWQLDGDRVIHHVQVSLFPDWVGTDLVRTVNFDGKRLILSGEVDSDDPDAPITNRITWDRLVPR